MSLLSSDTQLNQKSYYEASVEREAPSQPLRGDIQADAVVVGAGFSGLSCALELAARGMSVVVLEADRVCSGASGRNGGQAILGYASGQEPFERHLGPGGAKQAWDMSVEAIDLIDQRIAMHGIACDRVRGYLYVATNQRKARELLLEMEQMQNKFGVALDIAQGADVIRHIDSPRYSASAYERISGHLHPLKYGLGLARAARAAGVHIYEASAARALERGARVRLRTAQGSVQADFCVLAGNCTLAEHGPALAPEIAARIMPVGTYIVATEPLDPALCKRLIPSNASVCDNHFVLDYFRFSADHSMLFGGRVSYTTMTPTDLAQTMRARLLKVFPQLGSAKIDHVWGGFVDISMNRAPDFGRVTPNVYYLQGFSGHGVALTGLAGKLAAEAISGQAGRFDLLARLPHRDFPGGAWLRTPSLVLGTLYARLRDQL